MKKKAYLGIDIGSISTKGVIINENNDFLAESYLWTEGNPTEATKKVLTELQKNFNEQDYEIAASGTTGSARKLVGSMIGAQVVKMRLLPMQWELPLFILRCVQFWKSEARIPRSFV